MIHSMKVYRDYTWQKGIPVGIGPLEETASHYYKILTEPYHRYYVVEEYQKGEFVSVPYDSQLFDFRLLQPASQVGWRKESVSEDVYLIRNLEERIILREEYHYREKRCVSCQAYSPHGPLISTQKIFYKQFDDPFDGVVLYDSIGKPVLSKRYSLDSAGEFAKVTEEQWDMTQVSEPLPKP
jgi:hypothetical protein